MYEEFLPSLELAHGSSALDAIAEQMYHQAMAAGDRDVMRRIRYAWDSSFYAGDITSTTYRHNLIQAIRYGLRKHRSR